MHNENSARYGKVFCIAVWIIQCIGELIYTLTKSELNNKLVVFIIAIMMVGLLALVLRDRKTTGRSSYILFVLMSVFMAMYIVIAISEPIILLLLFILHWIISIFYFDKTLCYEVGMLQIFSLLLLAIISAFESIENRILTFEQFWISLVCIILCIWINKNLINILILQETREQDGKQSLDDMLNVVEVVCEETRISTVEKTNFIISLAQNIKSISRTIHGMNQSIKEEVDLGRIAEFSRKITEAEDRLGLMADEIIDYTQLEKGELVLNEKKYDFGEVLDRTIIRHIQRIKDKSLEYRINISDEVPRFMVGDERKVELILNCLLSNAINNTERGNITINIFLSDKKPGNNKFRLRIDVCDTGYGIKAKDQEKIFSPFYKAEENSNQEKRGIGLGLYIAKGLAELMSGDVMVYSKYGSGSTFFADIIQGFEKRESEYVKLFDYIEGRLSLALMVENGSNRIHSDDQRAIIKDDLNPAIDNSQLNMFPEIDGIDWSVALTFLPSKKIILNTLKELHKSGFDNADYIRKLYIKIKNGSDSEIEDFKVKIHAIKSNLKMIGAVKLSEEAKNLEYAARDGRVNFIIDNTEGFLAGYTDLINNVGHIPEIAEKSVNIKQSVGEERICNSLNALVSAMEDFDTDEADRIMSELETFECSEEIGNGIKEISGMVLNLNLIGVKKKVDELISAINS